MKGRKPQPQNRVKRALTEMNVKTFNFNSGGAEGTDHNEDLQPNINEEENLLTAREYEEESCYGGDEDADDGSVDVDDDEEPEVEVTDDEEDTTSKNIKKLKTKTKKDGGDSGGGRKLYQSSTEISENSDFIYNGGNNTSNNVSTIDFEKFLFFVEFKSGYIFRQFIEFTKRVSKELPLAFTRKGISTAYCSVTRQMIANTIIKAEDLTCYFVNEKYVNLPKEETHHQHQPHQSEWIHILNIDTADLVEHVKSVSKKDTVILSQRLSKPEVVQLQCCGNKNDGGIVTIRTRNYTPVSYNIVEANRRPTTCPNVTIQLSKFCNCLLSLVKSRFSKIFMRIYNEGITIVGTSQGGGSSRSASFGRFSSSSSATSAAVSAAPAASAGSSSSASVGTGIGGAVSSSNPDYFQINLSVQTVSALIKMMNFNTDGVVRIYCSTNTMARIETFLGCFGNVRVYVLDVSTNQKGMAMVNTSQNYKKYIFGC